MTSSSAHTEEGVITNEKRDSKFWDKIAEKYSKKPVPDEEVYQKKLAITQRYLHKDMKVLEFGCGTGSTAIAHASHVDKIHAIDISSKMITIAKEKASKQGINNVEFEQIGIDRLSSPNESYDVVLGLSVLHLLKNKDEVIRKVHTLLKPGGVFVTSTVCVGELSGIMKRVLPVGTFLGFLPHVDVFNAKELKKSIESAGFTIENEFQPEKKSESQGLFLVAKKNQR